MASLESSEDQDEKRKQFGNRFLTDPKNVFEHNAWDNVVWDEEQEKEARSRTQEQLKCLAPPKDIAKFEEDANEYWNQFYGKHENKFFKDRHWLFTEFPELGPESYLTKEQLTKLPALNTAVPAGLCTQDGSSMDDRVCSRANQETCTVNNDLTDSSQIDKSCVKNSICATKHTVENVIVNNVSATDLCVPEVANNLAGTSAVDKQCNNKEENSEGRQPLNCDDHTAACCGPSRPESFPGESAKYRMFEVGCGVGNTVFPILQANNDPDLMVYCCDYSSTAVQLVKENKDYDSRRCHAFVCDISDPSAPVPFPTGSLDIIIMIFILSANSPDKFQAILNRLSSLLKPGGMILFRDYGRYDLAQLRFKKGKCLGENFYVRGDGTRVYFFTQEELRDMMTQAGLEEVQNLVDRRLQVNRGKQLKMYRVWIQCKSRKPQSVSQHVNNKSEDNSR